MCGAPHRDDHSIHARDLVGEARGFVFRWELIECEHMAVGSRITLHPDRSHWDDPSLCLTLFYPFRRGRLRTAQAADRQTGSGKRMPFDQRAAESELASDRADFVFVERC